MECLIPNDDCLKPYQMYFQGTYGVVTAFSNPTPVLGKDKLAPPEKLVASQSLQVENIHKQPPRPFGVEVLGPPPQRFTTPTLTTMRAPPVSYPQLTNYRHNYQPKNIQEIIGYLNKPRSYDYDSDDHPQKDKERQATNHEGFKENLNTSSGFSSNDPFHPYKPTDPSEINLLATASFRFAPPVWRNFRKLYQQPSKLQQFSPNTQQVETSNIQETITRNFDKPFIVTLNVFPMEDQQTRRGQKSIQRIQSGYPYRFQGDSRARIFGDRDRGNKFTIRLNVFPEAILPLLEGEDNTAESNTNVKKRIKFL
ncbi:hypothetical protein NQ315_005106 [Exocentrus adspersus]|uniref:Uncharacterized protein n=1 Tax=Exocentrus adspersus TaxID=1586481 RepID=A0AAV8VU29_9CUCU|nr:hypothetical protein NQ315_005106 [Exocentrus adspersus]